MARRFESCAAFAVVLAWSVPLRAEEHSVLDDARAAQRIVDQAPVVALFETAWSLSEWVGTTAATRRWDSAHGWTAQVFTRIAYGTSWSVMMAADSLVVVAVGGYEFAWADRARFHSSWFVGTSVPSGCSRLGADGGCAVGIGSYSGLAFRFANRPWWIENEGGWIEQRVSADADRTLVESTWTLTPARLVYERVFPHPVLGARVRLGSSLTLGMHNAELHPRLGTNNGYKDSWLEMHPLDYGVGPGGLVDLRIDVFRNFSLFGAVKVTPLLLGRSETGPDPILEKLAVDRPSGIPTYREASFGASVHLPQVPMDIGLGYEALELSSRRIDKLGHGALLVRFEYELDISRPREIARP
jgi:hypothetical protein